MINDPSQYKLIERLVNENLELDFQTEQPNTVQTAPYSTGNLEQVNTNTNDSDLVYTNALITQIHDKLDILQQLVGQEKQHTSMVNVVKDIILTLMDIEAQVEYKIADLNALADIANNFARNNQNYYEIPVGNPIIDI